MLRRINLIDGVELKSLRVIPDERGRLQEILRNDDPLFDGFGQVYLTTTYPGVVKGWHSHKKQTDFVSCIKGMIKLVLYDPREDSPTKGEVMEIHMGQFAPQLVRIPAGVFHGWKGVSPDTAYIINIPDQPYCYDDPDEFRIDPHNNDIPYDWALEEK